jgi:hypothetical protein
MGDQRVVCVDLTEERDSEREHRQQGPPHGIVGTAGGNDGADRRERHQHERHQRDEPGRGPIRNLAPRGETQQIEETQERRKHDRECPKRQGSPCRRAEAYPTDSSLLLSCPLCHNLTLQDDRLPSVTKGVTNVGEVTFPNVG